MSIQRFEWFVGQGMALRGDGTWARYERDVEPIVAERNQLRAEVERWRKLCEEHLDEAGRALTERDQARAELTRLASVYADNDDALRYKVYDLEHERDQLQARVRELNARLIESVNECYRLVRSRDEWKAAWRALDDDHAKLFNKSWANEVRVKALTAKNEKLQARVRELEGEAQSLSASVESWRCEDEEMSAYELGYRVMMALKRDRVK